MPRAKVSLCGQPDCPGRRACRTCHAAYMREWRRDRALTDEQRIKDNARSQAGVYLRRGKIQREPCSVCGDPKAEMHHADYSKPREVRWLCRGCHLAHHAERIVKAAG